MKLSPRALGALAIAGTALVTFGAILATRGGADQARCGDGFVPTGARCLPRGEECPPPLERREGLCDAPDRRIAIDRTSVLVGPSDWEAEGRVAPKTITAGPFAIDAFEITEGKLRCKTCELPSAAFDPKDAARAASSVTRDEARVFCMHRGGRLPSEDEWIVAAAGAGAKRYPWGDTGAVCARAAFGLAKGPCARGAEGPDTAGAHPLGDSPLGLHDLAGNAAEWVDAAPASTGVVRGGSWATMLATELRTWSREELDPSTRDPRVGFRCAYDAAK